MLDLTQIWAKISNYKIESKFKQFNAVGTTLLQAKVEAFLSNEDSGNNHKICTPH